MKALKKILKKQKSIIDLLLQKPQQSFTPETFHSLRLAIKKLHAVFDLAKFCNKKFNQKKTFKPFSLIFQQTGKIRELQVETSLLEKYLFFNLPKEYSIYLKKELAKELKKFFSIINNALGLTLEKKYRKTIPFLIQLNKKKPQRYMDKKRTKIEKLLSQNSLKNKQIHLLRKRLKELQYNESSLNYNKQNRIISNKNILPELLGEWHDYKVTFNHLKKFINSNVLDINEINQLENLKVLFKFKKKLVYTKINATLSNHRFRKSIK